MKTDKEFKNEVYARASKERARIKKRNRVIMTDAPAPPPPQQFIIQHRSL